MFKKISSCLLCGQPCNVQQSTRERTGSVRIQCVILLAVFVYHVCVENAECKLIKLNFNEALGTDGQREAYDKLL